MTEQMRALQRQHPKTELPEQLLPLLVRFRDIEISCPLSRSTPRISQQRLDRASFRRATIEITDDEITAGITARLKWLKDLRGRYLGHFGSKDAPLGLHAGNFQKGTD
jgi:hypothetical protein